MPECMICLGPQRANWKPEQECNCKYTIHKKCWEEWKQLSHGDCIICRNQKQNTIDQQDLEEFDEPFLIPDVHYNIRLFVSAIVMAIVFILMLHVTTKIVISSIKDEL